MKARAKIFLKPNEDKEILHNELNKCEKFKT